MHPRRISIRFAPLLALALACAFLTAGGCVTAFDQSRTTLEAMHASGAYQQAAAYLDDANTKNLYSDKSRLLYWLERGAVALALDDHDRTIDLLGKAEDYMEVRREPTGSDELARWLLNDTAIPYYGEPYEEIYVNVLKLLAQLEAGRIQGGATVEARRASSKSDNLRDRYVQMRDATVNAGNDKFKSTLATHGPPVGTNAEGQFIESTLGDYLTAVTFLKSGDQSFQEVATRRLHSALELQRNLQGGQPVDESRFATLGTLQPSDCNLLIVGLSGRAPTMVPERFGPIPVYEWPVYFELPRLQGGSEEVGATHVVVEPIETTAASHGRQVYAMDKIEDFGAVAKANHERALPLIYTRTLLRSQLKAAGAFVATEAARHSVHGGHGSEADLIQLGMILGGMAFVGGTEKADLRCWTMLPGRADVGLYKLPPGHYRVHVEYLAPPGGLEYTAPPREVTISDNPADLSTVVEHYWR